VKSGDAEPAANWESAPEAVVWLHAVLTLVILGAAAWGFVQSTAVMRLGCVNSFVGFLGFWFVVVPLLLVGILSLVITVMLVGTPKSGINAALAFDLLLGSVAAASVVVSTAGFILNGPFGSSDFPSRLGMTLAGTGVVLLIAAEVACVWSVWWGAKIVRRGYAVFLVLMLVMLGGLPLAEYWGIRHVRGLRKYFEDTLVTVPGNAEYSVSRQVSNSAGHTDELRFSVPEYCWIFPAQHVAGDWHCENAAAVAISHGKPTISSTAEAREYLIRIGVRPTLLGTDLPTTKAFSGDTCYVIAVPAINGRFEITPQAGSAGAVLYVSTPLVISGKTRTPTISHAPPLRP
jgi:hypothetical protein